MLHWKHLHGKSTPYIHGHSPAFKTWQNVHLHTLPFSGSEQSSWTDRLSLSFFCKKEHLQGKWQFFLFWMAHRTHHLSTGLIVHSSCWIFLTKKTQYHWQNVIFYNYLLLYNKQKKIRHAHFFKNCLHFKKASIENDLPLLRKLVVYQFIWSCYMRRFWMAVFW